MSISEPLFQNSFSFLSRPSCLLFLSGIISHNPRLLYIHLQASVRWQKNILDATEKAWEYGAHDRKDYPMIVRNHLTAVFSTIIENIDFTDNELYFSGKELRDERRIKKTLIFIENNYQNRITIEDIAESADISVSTCLRLYKTTLNMTPVSYLIRYRLQRAADMLSDGYGSIADAAYACGFNNPGYFVKCFRKEYGMTPSQYTDKQLSSQ